MSRGDTVSRIADRYNLEESALLAENGIRNPQLIYPGQQIRLPGYADAIADTQISGSEAPKEEATEIDETQIVAALESDLIDAPNVDSSATKVEEIAEEQNQMEEERDLVSGLDAAQLALNTQQSGVSAPSFDESVVADQEIALDPAEERIESNEELSESLSADPSDYSVAVSDSSIEIQASETLGHYADWLGIRAWDIRRLNNMAYRDPVIIGERISIEFSQVNISEFELKRKDYHATLQRQFFANYRIQGAETYKVRSGDNIGGIAQSRYRTPVWLLRQYNPELDFNRIQIDQEIVFPVLERVN